MASVHRSIKLPEKQVQHRLKVLLKVNVITKLRLVNANLTTVFLLALLRLINQKSLLQLFGKMAVMVVQQPNLLNPCLITGY
ncbi:Uncharacterised protein [Acinetobacter baumannii]|nr:Uncharacterised protein [Acinetobacter baumannii]